MRVIALLAVYNEARFIEAALEHWQSQAVDVYLIDNDSTDRTLELAEQYRDRGLLRVERLARGAAFDLRHVLERKEELAAELEADWFIHADADEFFEVPGRTRTLRDALREVDDAGYNAVNFLELTFLPSFDDGDRHDHPDFQRTLRTYYPFLPQFPHRLCAWKRQPGRVDLHSRAGHAVAFPGLTMYPSSFVMRHYLALGRTHAVEKYCRRRHVASALARSWHGWREEPAPESLVFPPPGNLRRWTERLPLDTSAPRRLHFFDPRSRATSAPAAPSARRSGAGCADAALELLEEAASAETPDLLAVTVRQGAALQRLRDLLRPAPPLPSMRGWAMRPDSLLLLVEDVLERRPALVVELGSGASTVVLGLALKRAGGGRLVSLEQEERFRQRTLSMVEKHGLASIVEVIHTPIENVAVGERLLAFYDLQEPLARMTGEIDLLIVDGPPGSTGPLARYPALPLLHARLAPAARVYLDDADREDELHIRGMWLREFPAFEEVAAPETEKGIAVLRRRAEPRSGAKPGAPPVLALLRDLVAVHRSGLFDRGYYRRAYPDVEKGRLPALLHYMLHGAAEGRSPSARFDAGAYLRAHPDAGREGVNPLLHHLRARGER